MLSADSSGPAMTSPRSFFLLFALLPACSSGTPQAFSAPRTLPKAQRPVVWDAPAKDRLGLPDMGGAKTSAQDPAAAANITADTPSGWQRLPAQPEKFRHALWRVGGDAGPECYLTLGTLGGLAGNVTRWYGQFGQAATNPETLPEVELLGGKGRLVELTGTFGGKPDQAMLGIVLADGDRVTTLKCTGPAATLKEQRANFLALAKSMRLGGAGAGAASGNAAAGASGPEAGGKTFVGVTPPGWEQLPPQPERFRTALWRIAGNDDTECYVSGPIAGGVAGNLKRWYGQFGLDQVPALEALEVVELLGRPGRMVELYGTFGGKPGKGMLLAFVTQGDEVTTLKFVGPEAVVKSHRDQFLALAKSLRSASASPNPQAPPIQRGQPLPGDHPPVGGAPAQQPPPPSGPFTATVPAGWTAKAGSNKFLHHTFAGDGEVYLGQLGGGLKATLDIWRGEMGQGPMSDADFAALTKVAFLGEDSVLLDLAGDFRSMSGKQIQGARMLVAARSEGNTILFAKLVGAAAEVEKQLDSFRAFGASVRRAQ
jgi:hypothetical protein